MARRRVERALQCEARPSRSAWPPFITNRTRSSSLMTAIGSPATATRSANFPDSIAPMRSCQPNISAALIVTARITSNGGIPASRKLTNVATLAGQSIFTVGRSDSHESSVPHLHVGILQWQSFLGLPDPKRLRQCRNCSRCVSCGTHRRCG
jgi:hypothetical protein